MFPTESWLSVGLQPQQLPKCKVKLAPSTEGRQRRKEEAGHSRLEGGRCNKQRKFCTMIIFNVTRQIGKTPTCQNFKMYIENLTWLSHIVHLDGVTFLSQGCVLGQLLGWEGQQNTHSKDRRESEVPPIAWVQLTASHVLFQHSTPRD